MVVEIRHFPQSGWNHVFAYDNEKPVGDLEWAERPGRTYELHLDVEPGYQRQGVGGKMVAALEEFLKEQGKPMSLYSFSAFDNEKAYGFFTKAGFLAVRAAGFYGRGRDGWFYWKPIGSPD